MCFKTSMVGFIIFMVSFTAFSQQAGHLDTSFGNNGIVTTDMYESTSSGDALAVHTDGRIVVGGTCWDSGNQDFIFAQYLEDGSLDENFSEDGKLRLNFPGSDDYVNDIVVQDDDKIVAVGTTANDLGESSDVAVVRLNDDGTLDNSFSGDGMLIIDFGIYDFGRAVALQEDGKIVVAGYGDISGDDHYDLIMCRITADGVLDNTFGNNGKIIYDVGWETEDFMNDVVVYNQNIFVGGYIFDTFKNKEFGGVAVVKFDEEGNIDNSFGDNGMAYFEINVVDLVYIPGSKMAINENGIYVATHRIESGKSDMAIINFLHNGYPNDNFGDYGVAIQVMVINSNAKSIALQSDGKIVVAGEVFDENHPGDSFIARFTETGALDSDFGENYGVTIVDIGSGENDEFNNLLFDYDNRIIAGGDAILDPQQFSLARFYSGLEVGVPENNVSRVEQVSIVNPVNNHLLNIAFYLSERANIKADLYTLQGQWVGNIFTENLSEGEYQKDFRLDPGLVSGLYLLQVVINGEKKGYRILIR